jgi:hypothetical protein
MQSNESLEKILKLNTNLKQLENNRVQCTLTGHEMPMKVDIIEQYLQSKKYRKASEWLYIII